MVVLAPTVKPDKKELENLRFYNNPESCELFNEQDLLSAEALIFQKYLMKPNAEVLDLGCGTGRTTQFLHSAKLKIVAADVSWAMVVRTKERLPGVDCLVGNAVELPFPEESFDYVLFSYNGLDYLSPYARRLRALAEIRRVLRPGGLFIFSTHNLLFVPRDFEGIVNATLNLLRFHFHAGYKLEYTSLGRTWYFCQTVGSQLREVRQAGFVEVEIISSYRLANRSPQLLQLVDPFPYFVCKNPWNN